MPPPWWSRSSSSGTRSRRLNRPGYFPRWLRDSRDSADHGDLTDIHSIAVAVGAGKSCDAVVDDETCRQVRAGATTRRSDEHVRCCGDDRAARFHSSLRRCDFAKVGNSPSWCALLVGRGAYGGESDHGGQCNQAGKRRSNDTAGRVMHSPY